MRSYPGSIVKRLAQFKYLVRSDLFRHGGVVSLRAFCSKYLRAPGFRFMVWYRLRATLEGWRPARYGLQQALSWRLLQMSIRFGITLPVEASVGPGFYIGHFGGIVVHEEVTIGRDCNISQGVTLGLSSRGEYFGCPSVGDRVYLGPGAKVFGKIRIGNDAAIGANAVVTRDVPSGAVVAGMPARIISDKGSYGYICHTEYGEP